MECTELLAATQGLYGQRIAKDATYNRLVNDQGCRNTNKGCDIKVKFFRKIDFFKGIKLQQFSIRFNYSGGTCKQGLEGKGRGLEGKLHWPKSAACSKVLKSAAPEIKFQFAVQYFDPTWNWPLHNRAFIRMLRSMDLGPVLDDILDVKYTTGSDERERRKVKRKEKFCGQVRKAVSRMMVSNNKLWLNCEFCVQNSSSIFTFRPLSVRCPLSSSVTPNLISIIWPFRPHEPSIFWKLMTSTIHSSTTTHLWPKYKYTNTQIHK